MKYAAGTFVTFGRCQG